MPLILTQLRWELQKLFSRPRTYLGFAGFLAFEFVLLILLQRDDVRGVVRKLIEKAGYTYAENFTGPTIANLILNYTLILLGGVYLALVSGDIVSKEIEDGTMRMVLARPVPRWRVLLLKLVACFIYTGVLIVFVAVTSLLIGLAFEGPGNLFVIVDEQSAVAYAFQDGLMVYFFGALPLLTLAIFTVTAIAFMLSCFNIKPAAATVATMSIFTADTLLRDAPFLAKIRDWFLASRITSWAHIYDERVPWPMLYRNFSELLVLDVVVILIGWWSFSRRDLKP